VAGTVKPACGEIGIIMAEPALSSPPGTAPRISATAPAEVAPPRRSRPLRQAALTLVILVVAAAIAGLFATRWDRWVGIATRQVTDDAYVRGDITPLSAKVEGYVQRVAVDDFEHVKKGDLLVAIEDSDYRAKVAQAEADLLGAQAAIENLKARKAAQHAQVAQAESVITGTQADVQRTRLEAERQRALLATTFGTAQKVEQAVADEKRLAATLARNQAELDAQHRQLAVLDTQELQLRADAKAKQAMLDLAKINLGYTQIRAPRDGMVSERGVREGQYAHSGTQVISIVPLDNVWVIGNYKETQLTHVAIGQRAEIRVDTFPGLVIKATVERVAPASGSQFSLLPPDNATGNFTKVVQRIPVKLRIGPDNPLAGHLLPGMSVEATILTDTTPPPP
jgi:membrane fusion protein (multidrug efflux system)